MLWDRLCPSWLKFDNVTLNIRGRHGYNRICYFILARRKDAVLLANS